MSADADGDLVFLLPAPQRRHDHHDGVLHALRQFRHAALAIRQLELVLPHRSGSSRGWRRHIVLGECQMLGQLRVQMRDDVLWRVI